MRANDNVLSARLTAKGAGCGRSLPADSAGCKFRAKCGLSVKNRGLVAFILERAGIPTPRVCSRARRGKSGSSMTNDVASESLSFRSALGGVVAGWPNARSGSLRTNDAATLGRRRVTARQPFCQALSCDHGGCGHGTSRLDPAAPRPEKTHPRLRFIGGTIRPASQNAARCSSLRLCLRRLFLSASSTSAQ
jgi:hypothetical protein